MVVIYLFTLIREMTFRCHDLLGETIVIIFAELTRFCKSEDECVTEQDRLLYLLKNSRNLKLLPKWSDEEHCKLILDAFRIQNFDEQKRQGQLKAAHKEGREEGREEERLQNAKNLKALGVDLDIIAQGLGLDRKTVEEL